MSNEIIKSKPLPPAVRQMAEEAGEEFSVGDMFFHHEYSNLRVIRISKIGKGEQWRNNGKDKEEYWKLWYQRATTWDATKWEDYGDMAVKEFIGKIKNGTVSKITRPLSELREEAQKALSGEIDLSVYTTSEYEDVGQEGDQTNALIGRSSKQGLEAIQRGLEQKKRSTELIHQAIKYEMAKKKQEMERIKDKLYGAIEKFEKQVKRIMRVIQTIELYLGIDEELVQIQEGQPADINEPITFRQMVLFMDEEVGAFQDGGIDYSRIEEFDEWLTTGKHLDVVLPEKKGMVVLRPRRNSKEYGGDNWYANAMKNAANLTNTYILIRNGDNVYRIFSDKLVIPDRLFPLRSEMARLAEKIEKASFDREKEESEDAMHQYVRRGWLMQGLVDRTEVFKPLPVERLNIFRLDEHEELVRFIYDDEASLPTGKISFNKWLEQINDKIDHGSRVLLTGNYNLWGYGSSRKDFSERFYLASGNSYEGLKNVPDLPKEGVYEVEKFASSNLTKYKETDYRKEIAKLSSPENTKRFKDEGVIKGRVWTIPDKETRSDKVYGIRYFSDEPKLTIMYMPKEEASSGWNRWDTHERKVRTRFRIEKDDDFIINYDQITLEDIEFYIHSRVDRPNYLQMMPLLKKLRTHLLQEQEQEKHFVRFVADRNWSKLEELTRPQVEQRVEEAIRWWKFKNQWKRAINKDDAKALRMIEERIVSKNYSKFEKY